MIEHERRTFLKMALATTGAAALQAQQAPPRLPRLGVVTSIGPTRTPDVAIKAVHDLGFTTCQVSVGTSPVSIAGPLKEALTKYQIEATAIMTLGPGRMVWNFYEGPLTIGLVPPDTRAARIAALKTASDIAKQCGVKAVHTHCGFIPENPNEPLYSQVVEAIQEVTSYCRANQQTFLMETGQETPITLLRAIQDVNLDNLGVNLDTANLILYDKGNPVSALEIVGKYVRGMHAKDGLYPTNPRQLGKETPIGKGKVNFPEVFRHLHNLNYSSPVTIEREISGPQQVADIRAAKQYLENLINTTYNQ